MTIDEQIHKQREYYSRLTQEYSSIARRIEELEQKLATAESALEALLWARDGADGEDVQEKPAEETE